ncbi:uncharacterized protein F4822DRAFT_393448 [Hypoxylon trugodes]|uniref:uncharacterized protein n=1 Tax=Hypoxylon trugodes TaxID=326681 RepID=UPI00219C0D24|nr:uncharacterized protein F4822DRAFT_393448 [Hypoxylon trugodes]KAI1390532.1 hypothetical protein F4822DRAFT_393448 [Hypoxylon trugodes]
MDRKGDIRASSRPSDLSCCPWVERPPSRNTVSFGVTNSADQDHIPIHPLTHSSATTTTAAAAELPLPTHPLSRHLTKSMCRALDSNSRSFLPQNQLNALTPPLVKEELRRALPSLPTSVLDNYTTQIFGTPIESSIDQGSLKETRRPITAVSTCLNDRPAPFLRIFAILVLLGKVDCVPSFITGMFTDSLLPIDYDGFLDAWAHQHKTPSAAATLKQCFSDWTMSSIEAFIRTQYVVLSPVIGRLDDIALYSFADKIILPFLEDDDPTTPSTKIGGYSSVRKVKLHPSHNSFRRAQGNSTFALKRLQSCRIEDFQREVTALKHFATSSHPHIVNILAAFRHGASFYLLFPWAEGGDLRSFWKQNPTPTLDSSLCQHFAEQFLGIATAIYQIHYGRTTKHQNSASPVTIPIQGQHGDIKPENFLCFQDHTDLEQPTLVLSDFGLGRFHIREGRQDSSRPIGFSPTYRAPELDVKGTVDEAYDIWSLGCVFLESITWLLRGWEGVKCFAESRALSTWLASEGQQKGNSFFWIEGKPGAGKTLLSKGVITWIDKLASDREASPFLIDLLNLTQDHLLVTDWKARASSSFLVEKLQCLRQRCLEDPIYTVAIPSPRKPPWPTSKLTNLPQSDLLALASQKRMIRANMAQTPNFDDFDYLDPMMVSPESLCWSNANEQPHGANQDANFFDTLVDNTQATDNVPSHYPPSTTSHQSDQQPPEGPHGRRRTLDDALGPRDMGDQRKKKPRKAKANSAQNTSKNKRNSLDFSPQKSPEVPKPIGTTQELFFACPFFLRNPAEYGSKTWKACIGSNPGWKLFRLKEHIHRVHCSSSYRCDRCLADFEDISDLKQHHRSEPPCQKKYFNVNVETIDKAQAAQIRKKQRGTSDEDEWIKMYRIIFKLDSDAETPSPYYNDVHQRLNVQEDRTGGEKAIKTRILRRLEENNDNEQDTLEMTICLKVMQRFEQQPDGYSVPSYDNIPSLTYDQSNNTPAKACAVQGYPPPTSKDDAISPNIVIANTEDTTSDLPSWAEWEEVFRTKQDMPDYANFTDLVGNGEIFPGE